jgi:hypothetical protein
MSGLPLRSSAGRPMVRIMDAAVYMHFCQGGVLLGVYEETPRFFDMQSLGAHLLYQGHATSTSQSFVRPLSRSRINSRSCERLMREFRGGIPTMTAGRPPHSRSCPGGSKASTSRAAATLPAFQSRRRWERRSQRGSRRRQAARRPLADEFDEQRLAVSADLTRFSEVETDGREADRQ